MRYKLGISTCPNDTFMFHALLERRVACEGFELEIELLDVQRLNEGLRRGEFAFSKASCFGAVQLQEQYEVCDSGAALGYGVGPLLLARKGAPPLAPSARVLSPGDMTTANMLFRHFFPEAVQASHVVFSEIMPSLESGEADYGIVIHEGRFTYQEKELSLIADLGELWERRYSVPLPLGCIVADRALPEAHRRAFNAAARASIEYAYAHRDETLPTMKRYAQELSDEVVWRHVDLYVNKWSLELGADGRQAFEIFRQVAQTAR
jgi:1,4-dihydroxy-6-naphthoate synthase